MTTVQPSLCIRCSSNKLLEVLRDAPRAPPFPEASFPQLSISPWCLKRGTTAAPLRPFREISSVGSSVLQQTQASNCDVACHVMYRLLDDEIHAHTGRTRVKGTSLCWFFLGCNHCYPVFLCCSTPTHAPSSSPPPSYSSICLPCR